MAEYTVTRSELTNTAAEMRTNKENFVAAGDKIKEETEILTQSDMVGEFADVFKERIVELNTWIHNMGELLNEYAAALDKAAEEYGEGDDRVAKLFN